MEFQFALSRDLLCDEDSWFDVIPCDIWFQFALSRDLLCDAGVEPAHTTGTAKFQFALSRDLLCDPITVTREVTITVVSIRSVARPAL